MAISEKDLLLVVKAFTERMIEAVRMLEDDLVALRSDSDEPVANWLAYLRYVEQSGVKREIALNYEDWLKREESGSA